MQEAGRLLAKQPQHGDVTATRHRRLPSPVKQLEDVELDISEGLNSGRHLQKSATVASLSKTLAMRTYHLARPARGASATTTLQAPGVRHADNARLQAVGMHAVAALEVVSVVTIVVAVVVRIGGVIKHR